MGGNAIKSAKRINKETYDQYWTELQALFPELRMWRTLSYRQKEDFGDIDIVVQTVPKLNITEMVFERLGADLEHYNNGPFFSFLYKDAQVDFIYHNETDYNIACHYYSWNDVCNFIGRVARTLNFKFGHDGLFYEEHLDDHYKISVFVSRDIGDILYFLGYEWTRWYQGFDSINEILSYGASSKYFNSLYFNLEEQNNIDRVRNKKRKMYQNMLKYIEENKLEPKPKLTAEERLMHYNRAVLEFGNSFHLEVCKKRAEYAIHLEFKKLFNGDIVKEITGLEGKELGFLIQRIKSKNPKLQEIVLAGGTETVHNIVKNAFEDMMDD